jgi:hypothetical protein
MWTTRRDVLVGFAALGCPFPAIAKEPAVISAFEIPWNPDIIADLNRRLRASLWPRRPIGLWVGKLGGLKSSDRSQGQNLTGWRSDSDLSGHPTRWPAPIAVGCRDSGLGCKTLVLPNN